MKLINRREGSSFQLFRLVSFCLKLFAEIKDWLLGCTLSPCPRPVVVELVYALDCSHQYPKKKLAVLAWLFFWVLWRRKIKSTVHCPPSNQIYSTHNKRITVEHSGGNFGSSGELIQELLCPNRRKTPATDGCVRQTQSTIFVLCLVVWAIHLKLETIRVNGSFASNKVEERDDYPSLSSSLLCPHAANH